MWNPPVIGAFPSERANNAELFPFDYVVMNHAHSVRNKIIFVLRIHFSHGIHVVEDTVVPVWFCTIPGWKPTLLTPLTFILHAPNLQGPLQVVLFRCGSVVNLYDFPNKSDCDMGFIMGGIPGNGQLFAWMPEVGHGEQPANQPQSAQLC